MLRTQQIEASKSRAILEAIGDGVIVTDDKQRIVLFNAAASKIFGVEQEYILNQATVNFIGIFGTAGAQMADAVNYWSTKGQEKIPESALSDRLILDDSRVISFNSAPVLIGDEFLGTVSIFRDITQEVELDRLKSEFVATVSHELRTPMTSINGYVEILLSESAGPLNQGQKRFLQVVEENTSRLGTLVNDLLDISTIEAGRAELFIEAFAIQDLLEDARNYIEQCSQEDEKVIQVTVSTDPDLAPVIADKDRIRQVLLNLVDNSFNYTSEGGEIRLSAFKVEDELEISVADTGIGIPPEDLELVFERFYRGEQALDMGVHGTGLGLSIVSNYVEMHGGKLWAESEGIPGEGSRFVFTLPITSTTPKPEAV
jgi:PAS domain S-box-containing protein